MLLKLTKETGKSMIVNMSTIIYMDSRNDRTHILLTGGIAYEFAESIEDIEMMMNYGAAKGLVFVSEKGGE